MTGTQAAHTREQLNPLGRLCTELRTVPGEATYRLLCFLRGPWGVAELHSQTAGRVMPVSGV